MNIVYVCNDISVKDGRGIFDRKIFSALEALAPASILQCNVGDCSYRERLKLADQQRTFFIFSHFHVFLHARHVHRAKKIFLHHDVPSEAYFLKGGVSGFLKGCITKLYLGGVKLFSDRDVYISKREMSLYGNRASSSIQVGCPNVVKDLELKQFLNELIFTGNYKWSLKKKALSSALAVVRKYPVKSYAVSVCDEFEVLADNACFEFESLEHIPNDGNIRLGVITDDFVSGFKLKVLDLIANGCVVLTFASIKEEFTHIPHADLFIQLWDEEFDLGRYMDELMASPDIVSKYCEFRASVLASFSWQVSAEKLLSTFKNL